MFSPLLLLVALTSFREARTCSPIPPTCSLEGQLYCPDTGACASSSQLCGGKCLERPAPPSVRPSMRFRDGEVECYEDTCELECAYNESEQEELFGSVYCEECSQYCIMGKSCFGRCIGTDEECEA